MTTYGEYCPIAVGAEFFGDRWTPLVLRELVIGCRHFNDIHRGIPKMSRTLLSQRLRTLERRGIVERQENDGRVEYVLTPAGRALGPVIWALGHWAAHWVFGDPTEDRLDAAWLVWRMHQSTLPDKMPSKRTVIELNLVGPGGGTSWLVMESRGSTACQFDPGYDVDLVVQADNAAMHRWLLGRTTLRDEVTQGNVRFVGPSRLARVFPSWFNTSVFAEDFASAVRGRKGVRSELATADQR